MRRLLPALALLPAIAAGLPLAAQTRPGTAPGTVSGTAPGTAIVNTAAVTFSLDGDERRVPSNSVTLVVAERLDIALSPGGDIPVLAAPSTALAVRLTNSGSGQEAFAIEAVATVPAASVTGIAIDVDGDGRFDPAVDTMLAGATPPLAPGATMRLLVLVAPVPGTAATDGTVTVTVRAVTGSGTPADGFAGTGDGGGDAVVGASGGVATVALPFVAAPAPTTTSPDAPTLVKTQTVRATDGSTQPASGAVVTYTLVARFPGTARGARIDDPIPAGTRYVPGSLTLDDVMLTDAPDGDAGGLDGNMIAVTLGDVAPAAGEAITRTVSFQVRLP